MKMKVEKQKEKRERIWDKKANDKVEGKLTVTTFNGCLCALIRVSLPFSFRRSCIYFYLYADIEKLQGKTFGIHLFFIKRPPILIYWSWTFIDVFLLYLWLNVVIRLDLQSLVNVSSKKIRCQLFLQCFPRVDFFLSVLYFQRWKLFLKIKFFFLCFILTLPDKVLILVYYSSILIKKKKNEEKKDGWQTVQLNIFFLIND